eukprot:CAMPEP_0197499970 /NCGR_PEP_ID=MMETSP1311-20131121/61292_1 /TAXON_ID=464262 /ORGANISM="Genus nov. species nov., Strain RCC856" /LENGTH=97 /DNA_ID=CAMNT_0043045721 /DNA_START=736 /DNA_END=1027 /DNA_ORIENTATION=+
MNPHTPQIKLDEERLLLVRQAGVPEGVRASVLDDFPWKCRAELEGPFPHRLAQRAVLVLAFALPGEEDAVGHEVEEPLHRVALEKVSAEPGAVRQAD